MKLTHNPKPRYGEVVGRWLVDLYDFDKNLFVATVEGTSPELCAAHAAEIVRAVNCHEALITFVETVRDMIGPNQPEPALGSFNLPILYEMAMKALSAAAPEKEGENETH